MANRFEKKTAVIHEDSQKVVGFDSIAPLPPSWWQRDLFLDLTLVFAVILTYSPTWTAGFIWDDDVLIATNPCIVGPLGLAEIWTTRAADICPLTFTTFWVEHALWGLAPLPYHLVTVLLHGACAIGLWRVLRGLRVPGAWLGAMLWALHPVQVESVAWIIEMKNTQSGLFFLLAILFFLRLLEAGDRDAQTGNRWNYAFCLLFAALAMASKASTVILPVVLCLCVWWMEGRWRWRHLARVAPIFFMSITASVVAFVTGNLHGTNAGTPWARPWPERLAGAGDAVWFYLGKLLWPHPLMTIYPHWEIDAGNWISYLPLWAVVIVLGMLWLKRESWSSPCFFGFAYFLVALLPVLGLIDQFILRYSLVFDHFQYLASMGPLALLGAGLTRLANVVIPGKCRLQSALCAGLMLILGLWSWQRAWVYESKETLWTDAMAKNPNCWVGYYNRGTDLFAEGQVDKAITLYHRALEINPNYTEAYTNLGQAFFQKGQVNEAILQYQKALKVNPNFADAHYNLGVALFQKQQRGEAMAQFQTALQINPNFAEAYNDLGVALVQKGQVDEAIVQYQEALKNNPHLDQAHYNLGNGFLQNGEVDEAMEQYRKALEINPSNAQANYFLGNCLFQSGQLDEAILHYQRAVEIDPNFVEAHTNLGQAFFQKGLMDEAITQDQEALKINPNLAQAHYNLGNAFFRKGQVDEAIEEDRKALEIDPNLAGARTNLGIALVKKSLVKDAIVQFQEVVRLNPTDSNAQKNLARAEAMTGQVPGSK